MIVALMESLEGRPDLMSRSQMSNSLKLTKRETREQSVSSFVVLIMELHLNWSDPVTCSIEIRIEANFPVLHSSEVAHLYPQVMLPICQETANPIHLYRGGEAG
jgi:hypothetical protein